MCKSFRINKPIGDIAAAHRCASHDRSQSQIQNASTPAITIQKSTLTITVITWARAIIRTKASISAFSALDWALNSVEFI